ncbi:MAG TPA: prolipoprotein diacylglyceryl transferase, partial [Flavobacteriales bacterium]|nr:prolipoprotein diacylglyceryl transferase [Flavobacteriales bacterium]
NVNNVGVEMTDTSLAFPGYGHVLPEPVFPTPLYETLICLLFFGVLWSVRKRMQPAGSIFFLFLLLNGVERFFIEKIRVNVEVIGHWTQAEIIAVVLVLVGIGGIIWLRRRTPPASGPVVSTDN